MLVVPCSNLGVGVRRGLEELALRKLALRVALLVGALLLVALIVCSGATFVALSLGGLCQQHLCAYPVKPSSVVSRREVCAHGCLVRRT